MGLRTTVRAGDTIDESPRQRFENAWRAEAPLPIEQCLEGDGAARVALLEELVGVELENQWRIGRGTIIEQYLRRFPELGGDAERMKRLVLCELRARYRFGDRPAVTTYDGRFPELLVEDDRARLLEVANTAGQTALGRYHIESELGHGGFGRVWQALDPTLGRVVAVKQLHPHVARRAETRLRFVAEARVAARLEHPGVVPVYELGDGSDGPYFVMKLVRGETLADAIVRVHADGRGLAPDAVESDVALGRARLVEAFLAVARTMAFAHARGVIHRDLKPQNVVVGDYGETVILDWGIAKALDQPDVTVPDDDGSDSSLLTRAGAVMGTPAYMAPEQARGEVHRLDRRSDVFALGAMLYEVLTGRLPFPRPTSDEMIAEVASPRPVAVRPRQVLSGVPRALEAICLKALAKDPAERYPDAGALAVDLERHLAGAPVSAHRETVLERLARWARHHRGLVLTAGLALVVLTAGAFVAALLIDGERSQARSAEAEARVAQSLAASARHSAEAATEEAEHHLYLASLALAERAWRDGDLTSAERQLEATPADRRGWEWDYLKGLVHGALSERAGGAVVLAAGPTLAGGALLASSDAAGTVTIWERKNGKVVATVVTGHPIERMVLLANGRLAVLSGGRVRGFELTGSEVPALASGDGIIHLGRSVDGQVLLRVEAPNRVVRVDAATGAVMQASQAVTGAEGASDAPAEAVAHAPGLDQVVTLDLEQHLRLTDVTSGALAWDVALTGVVGPRIVLGATVVVAQDRRFGGRVVRFDLRTGQALEPATDFERPVTAIVADAGRDRFVAGTIDGALHVVDGGVTVNVIRAHHAAVRDLVMVGGELVSAAADGVRSWDPDRPQAEVQSFGYQLAFLQDGGWIDGAGVTHERWTGEARGAPMLPGVEGFADRVLFAGARDEAVVMVRDGVGLLLPRRAAAGEPLELGPVEAVATSRDRLRVGLVAGGELALWDVAARRRLSATRVLPADARPWWVALWPVEAGWRVVFQDARGLHAVDEAGNALWDVPMRAAPAAPVREGVVATSADGALLAVADGLVVSVREADTGALVAELSGTIAAPSALAFMPDGRRLVVADDARIGIWDFARRREVFELALEDRAARVVPSPDGRTIGVALEDGRIVLFNAAWPRVP